MAASDQHRSRRHDESSSRPNKKKKVSRNPETNLLFNLNSCSKSKDLSAALALYDAAITSSEVRLSQQHFQTLLYLCSASITDISLQYLAIDRGFEIFDRMVSSGISPNEASVTSVARLAAAKGNGDYAFKVVKEFVSVGGVSIPRLRTYAPALLCFCEKLEAEKGYEVEEHMEAAGIALEEAEISALLKLREYVGCVSEETLKIIEEWFCGEKAGEVGDNGIGSDVGMLREAVLNNGGGWHGHGWVGEGKWTVKKGNVSSTGRCLSCSEQLACVDTNEVETQKFVDSLVALAMDRKTKMNSCETNVVFSEFQDWLEKHGDYEAIVDGANIGLYQQNFVDGSFSLSQVLPSFLGYLFFFLHIFRIHSLLY
nr:hypothetical protein [Arabidopsis thaliana]